MQRVILLETILLPILAGILCLLFPRRPSARHIASLGIASINLANIAWLVGEIISLEKIVKIHLFYIENFAFTLELEKFSLVFAGFVNILWFIALIYNIGYLKHHQIVHPARFQALINFSIGATLLIAFAGSLLTSFVGYEFLTIITYFLVTNQGGTEGIKAGRVYFITLLASSLLLFLPSILYIYYLTGSVSYTEGGLELGINAVTCFILLLSFAFGLSKMALVPMHIWLPAAMVAPVPVSALLHAVAVVKSGIFIFLKILIYIFGTEFLVSQADGSDLLKYGLTIIAFIGIVFSVTKAVKQTDIKRLLAYSTINQLCFIIVIASLFRIEAIIAAFMQMLAHGISKIALFFVAGTIYTAANKNKLEQMYGLGKRMIFDFTIFFIAALSLIGFPPLAGFASKFFALISAETNFLVIIMIILMGALSSIYLMPILYNSWFVKLDHEQVERVSPSMRIAMLLDIILVVTFYVFAGILAEFLFNY